MKNFFFAVCSLVCIVAGCDPGADNEYYSYEFLKNDYDQVAIVASVDVQEVMVVDAIGGSTTGYARYGIRCQVIEPFKGEINAGQPLVYYSVAEKDYNPENYRGNKIVFLSKAFDKRKKEWVLNELENSSRPATKAVTKTMRKIRGQAQKQ
jgi:hypothetical protein